LRLNAQTLSDPSVPPGDPPVVPDPDEPAPIEEPPESVPVPPDPAQPHWRVDGATPNLKAVGGRVFFLGLALFKLGLVLFEPLRNAMPSSEIYASKCTICRSVICERTDAAGHEMPEREGLRQKLLEGSVTGTGETDRNAEVRV
jgi:hypothetical protein